MRRSNFRVKARSVAGLMIARVAVDCQCFCSWKDAGALGRSCISRLNLDKSETAIGERGLLTAICCSDDILATLINHNSFSIFCREVLVVAHWRFLGSFIIIHDHETVGSLL